MSVVANAHWSHKWVTPGIRQTGQIRGKKQRKDCFKSIYIQEKVLIKIFFNKIFWQNVPGEACIWIPCVTTGWAGLEGWKVTPGSPLGLGGVMLGEVAVAGFEPTVSCCLVDWGNLEQHLGQVGFRQAKGWDTYWEKTDKVWWRVAWILVWSSYYWQNCAYRLNAAVHFGVVV